MNKVIFLFLLFSAGSLSAQELPDTLTAKRKIFTSSAYLEGKPLTTSGLFRLYARSKAYDAEKRLKDARLMTAAGAGASLAGLAVSVHALIGTQKTEVVDNVAYTYYKRPVTQLLGGVALMAAGICVMEFGNDKRMQSIALFNKKKKHDALQATAGLTESGQVGVRLSF